MTVTQALAAAHEARTEGQKQSAIQRATELAARHSETIYVVHDTGLHFDRETGACRGPFGIYGATDLPEGANVIHTATP